MTMLTPSSTTSSSPSILTTATATTTNKSSLFQPLPSTTPPTINGNDVIVRRPVPTHFRSHSNSSFHSFSESSASSNTETTPACTSGSSIHSSRSSSEELSRVLQHVNGDDNVDTIDNSQESRELQQQQQHPSSSSPILLSPPGGGANSLLSSKPLPSLPMPLMSCPSSSSSLLYHHQQSQQQRKLSSFTVNSKGGSFSIYKKSNNHHFFHRQHQHQHQQKYEYQPSPQYSPPLYNNINQNRYHHHQQQSLGNNSNNIRRICTPTPHKPIRASPFEPIVKDKQCGKISPLPMHEYEAWIAKRDYERFLLSSSSSSTSSQQQQQQQSEEGKVENYTFRPVVITPTIFIDNDNDLALLEKSDNTIIQAESLDHHDYNTTTTAKNEPTNDNEHLFSVLHPPHPPSLSLPSHLLFEKQKKRKIDQVAV